MTIFSDDVVPTWKSDDGGNSISSLQIWLPHKCQVPADSGSDLEIQDLIL